MQDLENKRPKWDISTDDGLLRWVHLRQEITRRNKHIVVWEQTNIMIILLVVYINMRGFLLSTRIWSVIFQLRHFLPLLFGSPFPHPAFQVIPGRVTGNCWRPRQRRKNCSPRAASNTVRYGVCFSERNRKTVQINRNCLDLLETSPSKSPLWAHSAWGFCSQPPDGHCSQFSDSGCASTFIRFRKPV